jgi:SAM-dependent methyltransferase
MHWLYPESRAIVHGRRPGGGRVGRMWPFFAPSRRRAIDRALTLAGLAPGERFMDLGCGDGRVLVAAARRGAEVVGIEADGELVERARRRLARAGLSGAVVHGDIFECPLDADVIFTYLTPGTLQELTEHFQALAPGTRLVTLDFPVPDLVAAESTQALSLYRLPAAVRPPAPAPAWPAAATLVVTVPERQSLTCIELIHPGGRAEVRVSPELKAVAGIKIGRDHVEPGRPVAVDLRWEGEPEGTLVAGRIDAPGAGPHAVYVLFADEEGGHWELTDEASRELARHLGAGRAPRSSAELLAAAVGEVA